jgi:transcription termination/antitermination protein NusG
MQHDTDDEQLTPMALDASPSFDGDDSQDDDLDAFVINLPSVSDGEADDEGQPADNTALNGHAPVYQAEAMPQGTSVVSDGDGAASHGGGTKKRRWYIIHTYSGHENKVKLNLERRIESMNMSHKIFRVEVPQKPITKIKDGKRIEKDENLFPGYVLVEMIMEDDSWYVVRYTPGVTKFVGGEKKPIPARDSEIKRILLRNQPMVAKIQVDLNVGDIVEIISGPFAEFTGSITEVNAEKEKIKAMVSIFGRDTPVELVFSQVQKRS